MQGRAGNQGRRARRDSAAAAGQPELSLAVLVAAEPSERLDLLHSSWSGLGAGETQRRFARYGPNEPVRPAARHPLAEFAANFTHTLALLLWFAGGLAYAAGAPELGGAIVAVVAVNGVFAYIQEFRAARVVESLVQRVALRTTVLRDGVEHVVPARELVVGDVVRLAAGDIVPADCVLLEADALAVDLSLITGEPLPSTRSAEPSLSGASNFADLPPVAPAGSAVVTGTALAAVFATGEQSSLGKVATLVQGVHRGASVLERQVAGLSHTTALIAVLAGAATLVLTGLGGDTTFLGALTFATGAIVALVPEGLLPTLSVSLAIGARRMARRGAAIGRLSAVEIVGSATVICTDKTGTLTENSLSVLGFVPADGNSAASSDAVRVAVLCNNSHEVDGTLQGDPLDVALARWAADQGADIAALRDTHARLGEVPFDARRRYMSVDCEFAAGPVTLIKGAPEAVIELSGGGLPERIATAMAEAASRGERVLLLASGTPGTRPAVAGLVRFQDPPRPEVPAAIAACRRAGIRVVMLTGDHPSTARAVATSVGLAQPLPVTPGDALDRMTDVALRSLLRGDAVFARIDPAQKLRIVELLRRSGEVVVVTGDGVNDSPALRGADVGVAMGRRGTEVAKQAADIVLADDNFATIVAAIEEGRSIKANIRRFASYVFTSNVAELVPFLVYVFLPVPLPLAIIQVLAIDLGTDLLPALALGADPPSGRTMAVPPEPPERPLLTRGLALQTFLFFGLIEAALGLGAYFTYYWSGGWRPFESMEGFGTAFEHEAATLTFLGIVAGQVGCLAACRDGSLWRRLSLRTNALVPVGIAFEVALAVVLIYVPGLSQIFAMRPVDPLWLLALPAGAGVFIALDAVRRSIAVGRTSRRGRRRLAA